MSDRLNCIVGKHPGLMKMQKRFGETWIAQLGSLGGGNHFIELCLDEAGQVWVMLHSGSRGIGNAMGRYFIAAARKEAVLTAALWLVSDVIGLRQVCCWDSGRLFKRCGEPPRSLYAELPRRFCFSPVKEVPALIAGEKTQKHAVKQAVRLGLPFYRLEL